MHHSNEYKMMAIKLYLKLKSIRKVAKLLDCSKSSLNRWLIRYFENDTVERIKNQKPSVINQQILNYINDLIKNNPTITLSKIRKKLNKRYNIIISISYLFYIIKYKLLLTTKQLRNKYYPLKKLPTLKRDKIAFYKEIIEKGKRNIISIDESGLYLNMTKNNGRCKKGRRCYKTVHVYPFVKFNFICAIKYGKVIGYTLYEKNTGGIDGNKFNEFYNKFIKNKYRDNIIILYNARFHKSKEVIENINNSGNKILYTLFYNPNLNPIENLFSQLKNYIKNKSPDNYQELKLTIDRIFKNKIKEEHLKNYFNYLFIQANSYIDKNLNI